MHECERVDVVVVVIGWALLNVTFAYLRHRGPSSRSVDAGEEAVTRSCTKGCVDHRG